MIKHSKQVWQVGSTVKVGFLSLVVRAWVPTPGDSKPDAYVLTNQQGTKLYKFVPHFGLEAIDADQAKAMVAEARSFVADSVNGTLAKAAADAVKAEQINAIFA